MSPSEGARAGGTPLRATPFAAFPLLAIKGKETKKNKQLSTLIHSYWFKNSNPPWLNIGSAGWFNIHSALTANRTTAPHGPKNSDLAIQKLCDELNATETVFPHTSLRLILKLGSK